MAPNTIKILQKWLYRLAILLVVCGIVWANINRFNHNTFANYEKAVDYGRVREDKNEVRSVIAAVFYAGKGEQPATISSYMNHLNNYRTQNVKMLIVPETITSESKQVLEKLYHEIQKYNKISYIVFVHKHQEDTSQHQQLLQQKFRTKEIEVLDAMQNIAESEKNLNDFLAEPESLVVFAADIKPQIGWSDDDFLINEALYFAQKNFYKVHIFDMVDTQLAQAWEDNYAGLFDDIEKKSDIARQKHNLNMYAHRYEAEILRYFSENLHLTESQKIVWPQKTKENYRLFDRGYVYIRFFTTDGREIFSRAKVGKNKSVIVGVVEIAHKAAIKLTQSIESAKIYLLTDFAKIVKSKDVPLVNYLETDDGVYVQYRKKKALLAFDERPDDEDALMEMLQQRMQLPAGVLPEAMEFYKFKTVEINYEN